MAGSETIEWHLSEDTQPDDGMNVLLHAPDSPEPVWPGFFEDGEWYWIDGSHCAFDVIEWAELPVGSSIDDSDSESASIGYDIGGVKASGGIGFGEF